MALNTTSGNTKRSLLGCRLQAVEGISGALMSEMSTEGKAFHLIQAFIIQFKQPVSAFSSGINMHYEYIMSNMNQ